MVTQLVRAGFETLTEAGYAPEMAAAAPTSDRRRQLKTTEGSVGVWPQPTFVDFADLINERKRRDECECGDVAPSGPDGVVTLVDLVEQHDGLC